MSDKKSNKIVHIHLGEKNYRTVMHAGRHELISDEPIHSGGEDQGPDPYDYLLMSLGSCSVITMKMYADRKKWPIEELFIEMLHYKKEIQGDDGKPEKQDVIEKEVIIKGDLTEEQIERLVEISKKCPVHKTLMKSVEIVTRSEINE
jgi:putative redox protein